MSSAVLCQSSSCINGNPPSRMECPTCNKVGIRGSFFCGQECFKAGWKTHKLVHDFVKNPTSLVNVGKSVDSYNPFPDYNFTGTVRPVYPLSPKRSIPEHIPRPEYAITGEPVSELNEGGAAPRILNVTEIEKMRMACRLSREVLDTAAAHVRPGITTDELDEVVHNATIERNAYPSPLNYRGFPKSVCTSVNEVICHGIPDQRILQEGDIVNIDVSLFYDGYHGDVNGSYPVGKIDEESEKLIRTTRESLDAAIKICRPGALLRDIGKTIEPVARANGCAVVRTYTGHGIHELFHCAPTNVPHYAKNKAIGTMKTGMVFTIEPMLNLGTNWSLVHWPDDWTATTVDGKRSAQFEETLLITDTGVEVLTGKVPEREM
ncbi:peptidase M24, structural domain-containing protein [Rhodocollybia butyracea]|uniref:Methionine aminopeptidase n=1 Tax=Rhodocollybia butyracea TaxID=206335 RepID=A0A9P5PX30_9AGAR|nr:peptidase M24, structural domain-containing protein [Rhodocollybia butyracea]